MIEGSLEVKSNFRQYGQVEKQRWEESEKWEKKKEDQRRERVRGKKMQVREKVEKSRNTAFFQWFVAQEGSKVGSLKRRVRSHPARWEMKNCTPLWREAHFQVKMHKAHQHRTTFGSWDVRKVHTAVAWSTFPSQNVQYTTPHVRTTFGRSTLNRRNGKIARRIGTRPSPLFSIFHFWRRSRTIASFLMSSTRKSRRIAAFLALSSSKTEEVSQNCCVFKLADRQTDRQTDRQIDR